MGDMADGLLNGDFDEETGEYIGSGQGFPRSLQRERRELSKSTKLTEPERKIKHIRKELAILIQQRIKDKVPEAVNGARQLINIKYGKGWREKLT